MPYWNKSSELFVAKQRGDVYIYFRTHPVKTKIHSFILYLNQHEREIVKLMWKVLLLNYYCINIHLVLPFSIFYHYVSCSRQFKDIAVPWEIIFSPFLKKNRKENNY